jgi:hypothetical protein
VRERISTHHPAGQLKAALAYDRKSRFWDFKLEKSLGLVPGTFRQCLEKTGRRNRTGWPRSCLQE